MTKKVPGLANFMKGILGIVAVFCFLSSCNKVSVDLGSDFVDNSTTNLVMVDSATVEISTLYVDSFVTSGGGSILVGKYKDPQFGTISSNSFIQMGAPPATTIPHGAVFDSLEVILKLNKTYYGDTLSPYSIAIRQLTVPIKLPNAQQYAFYNVNKSDYNTTDGFGSITLKISPSIRDTLAIRISQSLGQEIFDKIASVNGDVSNSDLFTAYFKGLALIDSGNNNLIVGFKDSMVMRLHYQNPGVFTTGTYVDFAINNTGNQYNHITADRAGTPLAALSPTNRQLFSTQTQNAGFSQYISGAMIKIRFPYLHDIQALNDFIRLIKADLILKPVKSTFAGYYTLPPQLRLSQTDQYNALGTDLSAFSAAASAVSIEYGNLYIDNLYGTQTAYTYDITTYLQQELANTNINKDGLLVLPPNQSQIFNRVVIGDRQNKDNISQVKIYYATVK